MVIDMRKFYFTSGFFLLVLAFWGIIFPSVVLGSDAECRAKDLGNGVMAGFGFTDGAWDCAGAYPGRAVKVTPAVSTDGGATFINPDGFYINYGDGSGWQPGAERNHTWVSEGYYTMVISFYIKGVHYSHSQVVRVASQLSISNQNLSATPGNTATYTYNSGSCIAGVIGDYVQGNNFPVPPISTPPTLYSTSYTISPWGANFGSNRICPGGDCYSTDGWQSSGNSCSRATQSVCTWTYSANNYGVSIRGQSSITWSASLSGNSPLGTSAYWNISNIKVFQGSCMTYPMPVNPPTIASCTASFNNLTPGVPINGWRNITGTITAVSNITGWVSGWQVRRNGTITSSTRTEQLNDPVTATWNSAGVPAGMEVPLFLRIEKIGAQDPPVYCSPYAVMKVFDFTLDPVPLKRTPAKSSKTVQFIFRGVAVNNSSVGKVNLSDPVISPVVSNGPTAGSLSVKSMTLNSDSPSVDSVLNVTYTTLTPPGTYTIKVVGTRNYSGGSGNVVRTAVATLVVPSP